MTNEIQSIRNAMLVLSQRVDAVEAELQSKEEGAAPQSPRPAELRERLGKTSYDAWAEVSSRSRYGNQHWNCRSEESKEKHRFVAEKVYQMRDAEVAALKTRVFRLETERDAALKSTDFAVAVRESVIQEMVDAAKSAGRKNTVAVSDFIRNLGKERDEAVKRAEEAEQRARALRERAEEAERDRDNWRVAVESLLHNLKSVIGPRADGKW